MFSIIYIWTTFSNTHTEFFKQFLCSENLILVVEYRLLLIEHLLWLLCRVLNVQLGEASRRAWLGVEVDPLAQSDDLLKVYRRTSENEEKSSSKWFISKNAVVSGLGLLGIKQGVSDSMANSESSAPKARRKRIVRKKVAAGTA